MQVDRDAPIRFLRAAFLPDDWIAVLLKRHDTGEAVQRVGPVAMVLDSRFQAWLRFKNARRFDVFVSINALTPGRRSRTRESVTAVRHIFLDADKDADQVMSAIKRRSDLPTPSFIVRSSEGRAHVLWRVEGMSVERAEALQKHLARELGADMAATSAAQMTRLPGFLNYKYAPPQRVTTDCGSDAAQTVWDLASISAAAVDSRSLVVWPRPRHSGPVPPIDRAQRYLAATPPAVLGEHGDAHTFRVCCRLLRTFSLSDGEAISLLERWNERCEPPWSRRDLLRKLASARQACIGSDDIAKT